MKQTRMKSLPWIIVAIVLVGLLAYGLYPRAISVEIVSVSQGELEVSVIDDGETRVRERFVVSTPVSGKQHRIALHAGDRVVKGVTEIARIEPPDPSLLDARSQAESLARAHAAEAAVRQTDADVNRLKDAMELAEHDYQRAQGLFNSKAISRAEFDQAEHQSRMAQAELRAGEFAKVIADFELQQARAAHEIQTVSDRPPSSAFLQILSPIDGTVLRVLHEDAGVVTVGTALVELGNTLELEVVIDVLSTDAVRIKPGQKVVIENWGGRSRIAGRVRLVEPMAFLKISALGVEEKRVNVLVDIDNQSLGDQSLGDGYRIEARIIVDSASPQSLLVPGGVLFRWGEGWSAYKIENGRARLTPLETGLGNFDFTQILKGARVGDRFILYPSDKIRDGIRVIPLPSPSPPRS